jgi:hypothetical protein
VKRERGNAPALRFNLDVGFRQLLRTLSNDLQKNEESIPPLVEDAVEGVAVMATELTQFTPDLTAVRTGQGRMLGREHIQSIDLKIEGCLHLGGELINEFIHRLGSEGPQLVSHG